MEGELSNFLTVWSLVLASLCYCYSIDRHFPAGIIRPVAIIPIAFLFFLLPLKLTTLYLGGTTSFFIAWLANFKLLLFAFGQGPLASNPPLSLSRFLTLACLPIKFQHQLSSTSFDHKANDANDDNPKIFKKGHKPLIYYVLKIVVLALCIYLCQCRPPKLLMMLLYCLLIYLSLEIMLAIVAIVIRTFMRVELEPQFDEPYLATSLQDFWGRRWNLMVSNILRPTVYLPVRHFFIRVVNRELAAIPAVLATFLVSGLMHELILYIIGRQKPTGEMTWFFLVNGICLSMETVTKRALKGRFCLPKSVSRPLTLSFLWLTSSWLFFPPVLRCKGDLKGCTETLAIIESLKSRRLISPVDMYCELSSDKISNISGITSVD